MTPLQHFRLQPRGVFHFGVHGIGVEETAERCPSDTLYAALLVEAQRAGRTFFAPPEAHDGTRPLDPPLLLSSAFPYAGDVVLLPRPQLPLPISVGRLAGERKLTKLARKLRYVSPTIFRLIVAQQPGALDPYLPGGGKGRLVMDARVWVAAEDGDLPETDVFWKVNTVPHVAVDRVQSASNYYETGQVSFAPGCGLALLCRERSPRAADGLLDLLDRLGDSGLGGRRSYGLGQFRPAPAPPLDLDTAVEPQQLVLLSRYRPSSAELAGGVLGEGASYDLVQVGGWLQTPADAPAQRRRSLRMLGEGSVIRVPEDGTLPIGTICDVRPVYASAIFPHPVWRYGLALGVGRGA
ncbi:MAG TPA: hypothetical protein VNL77_06965 [Roseiflexaceae bacterium]|nr:hypothetical protein [Roseiflexaceae bacterium]